MMKCYYDECEGTPIAVCQCNGLICNDHMVRTKSNLICQSCADKKIFETIKNLIISVGDTQGKTIDIKFSKKLSFEVFDYLEKRLNED